MARVSISVNGYTYDVACGDGEERHILKLAQELERRVAELVGAIGQGGETAGEARLLAMTGLMMADELAEARREIEALRAAAQSPAKVEPPASSLDEDALAQALEIMAERIETIAQRVERT